MASYWSKIPFDLIIEQVKYLSSAEIRTFCEEPYINEKLYLDPNGRVWEELYKWDFSDEIKRYEIFSSLMSQYLSDKEVFERKSTPYTNYTDTTTKLCTFSTRGYDK